MPDADDGRINRFLIQHMRGKHAHLVAKARLKQRFQDFNLHRAHHADGYAAFFRRDRQQRVFLLQLTQMGEQCCELQRRHGVHPHAHQRHKLRAVFCQLCADAFAGADIQPRNRRRSSGRKLAERRQLAALRQHQRGNLLHAAYRADLVPHAQNARRRLDIGIADAADAPHAVDLTGKRQTFLIFPIRFTEHGNRPHQFIHARSRQRTSCQNGKQRTL